MGFLFSCGLKTPDLRPMLISLVDCLGLFLEVRGSEWDSDHLTRSAFRTQDGTVLFPVSHIENRGLVPDCWCVFLSAQKVRAVPLHRPSPATYPESPYESGADLAEFHFSNL